MISQSERSSDYRELLQLAKSRNIEVLEGRGFDNRDGLRFQKNGKDFIVLSSSLSMSGKTRALGFLLEHSPSTSQAALASSGGFPHTQGSIPLLSLRCPSL